MKKVKKCLVVKGPLIEIGNRVGKLPKFVKKMSVVTKKVLYNVVSAYLRLLRRGKGAKDTFEIGSPFSASSELTELY